MLTLGFLPLITAVSKFQEIDKTTLRATSRSMGFDINPLINPLADNGISFVNLHFREGCNRGLGGGQRIRKELPMTHQKDMTGLFCFTASTNFTRQIESSNFVFFLNFYQSTTGLFV